MPTKRELSKLSERDLCLPVGIVARRMIQAASGSYPRFRVKMFGYECWGS